MAVLRILFTRLRTEEKLLKEAAERLGIPCELQLVSDTVFGGEPFCSQDDVVLARCVSHNQNEAVAQMLETQGIRVVNSSHVMGVCGNKLTTSCVLEQAGVPQPKYLVAFTQEGALDAVERLGYSAVCKPVSGSWGRLLAKLNDRESAEAVFEHKAMLGAIHNTFYIQEFVDKGSYEVSELLRAVHRAIGGEFLAVDLFKSSGRWLVNEVNDGGEFRNSIAPTGKDIPGAVVEAAWNKRR